MTRMITAAFDTRSAADSAVQRLVSAGIGRSQIRILPENETHGSTRTGAYSPYDTQRDDKGFWATLGSLFMPEDDRSTYTEALHRGHYIVSANVDDSLAAKAEDILDDDGTLDLNEHERKWRNEGWTGYRSNASPSLGATGATRTGTTATQARGQETIPIAEERLNIGKRIENTGRVRVRSFVVETPVHETVELRQEHVNVERRPVDRPLSSDAAFKERTIEATESSERAVVNKEARVTEEVVINKQADTRRETIDDTVRKTKVEVEDDRTKRGTGTTGLSGSAKPGTRNPL